VAGERSGAARAKRLNTVPPAARGIELAGEQSVRVNTVAESLGEADYQTRTASRRWMNFGRPQRWRGFGANLLLRLSRAGRGGCKRFKQSVKLTIPHLDRRPFYPTGFHRLRHFEP